MQVGMPMRKMNRLHKYDYSQNGAYFITFCTKDGLELLWEVSSVGANSVRPRLSAIGSITQSVIMRIPAYYPAIQLGHFVVMPNHVHLILVIQTGSGQSNGGNGQNIFSPTISRVIKHCKETVTKQIGTSIWQRSFHDRILRNESEYVMACQYILDNPTKWLEDMYYVGK